MNFKLTQFFSAYFFSLIKQMMLRLSEGTVTLRQYLDKVSQLRKAKSEKKIGGGLAENFQKQTFSRENMLRKITQIYHIFDRIWAPNQEIKAIVGIVKELEVIIGKVFTEKPHKESRSQDYFQLESPKLLKASNPRIKAPPKFNLQQLGTTELFNFKEKVATQRFLDPMKISCSTSKYKMSLTSTNNPESSLKVNQKSFFSRQGKMMEDTKSNYNPPESGKMIKVKSHDGLLNITESIMHRPLIMAPPTLKF